MTAVALLLAAICAPGPSASAGEVPDYEEIRLQLAGTDRGQAEAAADRLTAAVKGAGSGAMDPLAGALLDACRRFPDSQKLWNLLPGVRCPRDRQTQDLLAAMMEAELKGKSAPRMSALLLLCGTLEAESVRFWPAVAWGLQQGAGTAFRDAALLALMRIGRPAGDTFAAPVAAIAAKDKRNCLAANLALVRMGRQIAKPLAEAVKADVSAVAHACLSGILLEDAGRELLLSADGEVQWVAWYWMARLAESAALGLPDKRQLALVDPRGSLEVKLGDVKALIEQAGKSPSSEKAKECIAGAGKGLEQFEGHLRGRLDKPASGQSSTVPAKPPAGEDVDF
jgi:hypothetical protein